MPLYADLTVEIAPHAGAWIETTAGIIKGRNQIIAPHAGAWIETEGLKILEPKIIIAPHAGAWIETMSPVSQLVGWTSPPMRGRGLKRSNFFGNEPESRNRPPCGGVD